MADKNTEQVTESDEPHRSEQGLGSKIMNWYGTPDDWKIEIYPMPYGFHCSPYQDKTFQPQVASSGANSVSDILRMSKIIIVGDVAVGKTCLVTRFCHNTFNCDYKSTIGVDFEIAKFDILGIPFNLQIWDTAGQERFKCIASSYYRKAQVIILVFDFSNMYSLHNMNIWLEQTLKCNDHSILFLVGTKKDIVSNSLYLLTEKEAISYANEIKAEYWPVSAKTGENVTSFFCRVAALAFTENMIKEFEKRPAIKMAEKFVKISKVNKHRKSGNKCFSKCS